MEKRIVNKLYKLSKKASNKDEVPVAAILVCGDKIIAKAFNKRNKSNLTIDHAEIRVITKANKRKKSWRLNDCSLYVTLEPCEMCLNVIKEARIDRVYFLIKRSKEKKQFDKTKLIMIDYPEIKTVKENYKKNLSNFWKNKRKK